MALAFLSAKDSLHFTILSACLEHLKGAAEEDALGCAILSTRWSHAEFSGGTRLTRAFYRSYGRTGVCMDGTIHLQAIVCFT